MTHYEMLGVQEGVSHDHIRSSYRLLMRQYHPDLFQSQPVWVRLQAEAKCKDLNEAYAVLSSPDRRAAYDAELYTRRHPATYVPSAAYTPRPTARPTVTIRRCRTCVADVPDTFGPDAVYCASCLKKNIEAQVRQQDAIGHCSECGRIATNMPLNQDICWTCKAKTTTVTRKPAPKEWWRTIGGWFVCLAIPYLAFPLLVLIVICRKLVGETQQRMDWVGIAISGVLSTAMWTMK